MCELAFASPWPQLGPLRNVEGVAEVAGSMSAAGLVLILALCLSIYGSAQFQSPMPLGVKTLSGRNIERDPLFSSQG
jgi:photosystem I subunit 11